MFVGFSPLCRVLRGRGFFERGRCRPFRYTVDCFSAAAGCSDIAAGVLVPLPVLVLPRVALLLPWYAQASRKTGGFSKKMFLIAKINNRI